QERYRKRYVSVPASVLTELRDIPSVSGEVIWLKQLKRQLDTHEKRVEAVLGEKWQERYNTGQQLAQLIARFATKLDPKPIIEQWVTEANSLPQFDTESFIFSVDKGISGTHMSLKVNFDDKYVTLFKEMRRLTALGIRIHKGTLIAQRAIQNNRIDVQLTFDSIDVKRRYPVSVKLKEAVSIFTRTCQQIERSITTDTNTTTANGPTTTASNTTTNTDSSVILSMMPELFKLVDEHKKLCQRQIVKGADRRWSTPDRLLNEYVDTLAKYAIDLQDGTQK
ncbi:cytoplasmic dynein heavy chain, partial [Reticulomyxa filosa]